MNALQLLVIEIAPVPVGSRIWHSYGRHQDESLPLTNLLNRGKVVAQLGDVAGSGNESATIVGTLKSRCRHWRSPMSDDDSPTAAPRTASLYPYLVIRFIPAVYQRDRIQIRVGPPAVEIVNRRCFVQHPAPFTADGTLSPDCRELLIAGVQTAVRRLGFRMWIAWAQSSCTSIEPDRISPAGEPSGGSVPFKVGFTPHHYEPPESSG
jgi:hypothetical protein